MSIYHLLQASQTATSATPQTPGVKPAGGYGSGQPPAQQQFELVVSGVNAVSATAQVYGSNDDPNGAAGQSWTAIGDPITATGSNLASATFTAQTSYGWYTAALTALTGTSAVADVKMSA
ncbi:MAG TPA: hypothetical protein VMU59_07410 [Caulobacteraceae bacterium]|nr:hypothetical protein [Caulobacteraceae bacterium]